MAAGKGLDGHCGRRAVRHATALCLEPVLELLGERAARRRPCCSRHWDIGTTSARVVWGATGSRCSGTLRPWQTRRNGRESGPKRAWWADCPPADPEAPRRHYPHLCLSKICSTINDASSSAWRWNSVANLFANAPTVVSLP